MPNIPLPVGARFLSLPQILTPGGTQQIADIDSGNVPFSVLQPLKPFLGPVPVRQRQTIMGENLIWQPGGNEMYGYWILREFADSCELMRACIDTLEDRLCNVAFEFRLKRGEGEPQAKWKLRNASDKRIPKLQEMFRKPDGVWPWKKWLRMLIEDSIVIDAQCIYKERDVKGRIASLRVIDGATINRCSTEQGFIPPPPSVAFQQVLYGLIWCDMTTDDMTYVMRNPRSWKRYGYCYDSQTEVLTRRGWLKFSETNEVDEFATRNPGTREFEWQRATAATNELYEGEMYHCHSRSVDLLVTPNHRMLVSRLCNKNLRREEIIEAQNLQGRHHREVKIPMTSHWSGVAVETKIFATDEAKRLEGMLAHARTVGRSGSRGMNENTARALARSSGTKPVVMSGDEFCAFMGAYLSEGWTHVTGVYISQREKSKGFAPYRDLLQGIFGRAKHTGMDFSIPRRALRDYLRPFGESHEKFIPEEIMNATQKQIRLFWDHFMLGDGRQTSQASASKRGNHPRLRESTHITSKRMADQLVELAQKLGWSASVATVPEHTARICNQPKLSECRESYVVSVRYSEQMGFHVDRESYRGSIHCVTVPNGILYVRRNGKPAWSGNSVVEQCLVHLVIAIRQQKFVEEYFTSGNMPEALCFLPSDLPIDKVREIQGYIDSILAGDLAKRRRLTFLPGYGKSDSTSKPNIVFPKEVLLKDPLMEWLFQLFCYKLGVSPQAMLRMMNRATAQTAQETSEEEGLDPKIGEIEDMITGILQDDLGIDDIEFAAKQRRETDITKQAAVDKIYVDSGIRTRNQVRENLGDDPDPSPEASKLMITTASGVVPLDADDALDQMTAQFQAKQEAQPEQPNNNAGPPKKKPAARGNKSWRANGRYREAARRAY